MKTNRNISGIVLAVLCFLLAAYYIWTSIPFIGMAAGISRAVIVFGIFAGLYIYLGVIALLRGKRAALVVWIVLFIISSLYASMAVLYSSHFVAPYRFLGITPLERWFSTRNVPSSFLISIAPALLLFVLAILSHNRRSGKTRLFAKIIWMIPGVISLILGAVALDMMFIRSFFAHPFLYSICNASPIILLLINHPSSALMCLVVAIYVAKDFLLGFWIVFPDRAPSDAGEVQRTQTGFTYVPDDTGRFGYCPSCGASLPEAAMFCGVCGSAVNEPGAFCPNCGQKQEPTDHFCKNCGTPVKAAPPQVSATQPAVVTMEENAVQMPQWMSENPQSGLAGIEPADVSSDAPVSPMGDVLEAAAPIEPDSSSPVLPAQRFCEECGSILEPNDLFCSACGRKQTPEQAPID